MVVGTKISQMDPLATLAAGDVAPVVRGTFNYKFDLGAKITSMDSATALKADVTALAAYTTSATYAASGGSALVGFLQSGTNAQTRTLQSKDRDVVSVLDYAGATFTTQFQNAVAYAPLYSTIVIPAGAYVLESQIAVTRKLNLVMLGGYIGCTFGADTTSYAIDLQVRSSGDTDSRGVLIEGFRMFPNSGTGGMIRVASGGLVTATFAGTVMTVTAVTNGGVAVGQTLVGFGITAGTTVTSFGTGTGGVGTYNLSTTSGTLGSTSVTCGANTGTVIDRCTLASRDTGGTPSSSSPFAIRIDGYATHGTLITNCPSISGGIGNFGVDNMRVWGNTGAGTSCFFYNGLGGTYADLDNGAFGNSLIGNNTQTRDGALWFERGGHWLSMANSYEQSSAVNTNTYKAQCVLKGDATHIVQKWDSIGDNWGGGTNCEVPIHIEAYTKKVLVDRCILNPGSVPLDVRIATGTVDEFRMGKNNAFRGTRASADASYPALISDSSVGSYGVAKGLTLSNGWTAPTAFFVKSDDNRVTFTGKLVAGTLTAGTTIFTLPTGYRPRNDSVMLAYDTVNAAVVALDVNATTGVVSNRGAVGAGGNIDLTGCSLTVQGRPAYVAWP